MRSGPCKILRRQGYQFFTEDSSAAVKPCLWCKRALRGGEQCYKHQFYGIASHRCVQMTPTLRCTQACLFCWRSFEHEVPHEAECPPELIVAGVKALQKKALSGYKVSPYVTPERFAEALEPRHVALSLSGEPTLYEPLPRLIDLFHGAGYTTFLVSNGTRPGMLEQCRPTQLYVSLDAPDKETYRRLCQPKEDSWEAIGESLNLLGGRRSAIRITLVRGLNDFDPDGYARPSVVKVVTDDRGDALYFSRAPIPHYRDAGRGRYRKHLGIYGYRKEFLFRVAALPPSPLEEAERLEQLRVLQHGFRIRVVDVRFDSVGVDTPEDLRAVEEKICGRKGR